MTSSIETSVAAGLDYLERVQLPSGEFPCYATPLGGELDWQADSSVFVTALCVLALGGVESARTAPLIESARRLLRTEAAPGPLWRFWTHDHDRHREIPCDADDSSCVTLALDGDLEGARRTRRMLLANRSSTGCFYTWFVPRGVRSFSPRLLRTTAAEARARRRREVFWEMTEARSDDVDGVVNANVLRLLGPDSPADAVAYVGQILSEGREAVCDSWHRNPYSFWYSVADGVRRGVPYSADVSPTVIDRVCAQVAVGVDDAAALDLAHAVAALCALGGPPAVIADLCDHLRRSQAADGSWARSIFFYGGPKEVFAWGSEALSTSAVLGALAEAGRQEPAV